MSDYPDGLTLSAQDDAFSPERHPDPVRTDLEPDFELRACAKSPEPQSAIALSILFHRYRAEWNRKRARAWSVLMPVGACNGYWYGEAGMLATQAQVKVLSGH